VRRLLAVSLVTVASLTFACSNGAADGGDTADGGESDTTGVGNEEFPEQAAAMICGYLFECSCPDPGHTDEAACITAVEDSTRFDHEKAQNAALAYDPACGESVLQAYDIRGCAVTVPTGGGTCAAPCRRYVGDKAIGEPCDEVYLDWNDCAQGLICEANADTGTRQCTDPCGAGLPLGGECIDTNFQELGTCALDLYCDPGTRLCSEYPEPGDPCGGQMSCAPNSFCNGSGASEVCELKRPEDEPCSYPDWCAAGLYCEPSTDVCTPLPTTGLPCALGGTCDPFSMCVDGTCEAGVAIACVGEDALGG
jgi:hypothetical protein